MPFQVYHIGKRFQMQKNVHMNIQAGKIATSRNQMQSSGVEPFLMINILFSFKSTAEWPLGPLHGLGCVPSTVGFTLQILPEVRNHA